MTINNVPVSCIMILVVFECDVLWSIYCCTVYPLPFKCFMLLSRSLISSLLLFYPIIIYICKFSFRWNHKCKTIWHILLNADYQFMLAFSSIRFWSDVSFSLSPDHKFSCLGIWWVKLFSVQILGFNLEWSETKLTW